MNERHFRPGRPCNDSRGKRQEIQFGLGYRHTRDHLGRRQRNTGTILLTPSSAEINFLAHSSRTNRHHSKPLAVDARSQAGAHDIPDLKFSQARACFGHQTIGTVFGARFRARCGHRLVSRTTSWRGQRFPDAGLAPQLICNCLETQLSLVETDRLRIGYRVQPANEFPSIWRSLQRLQDLRTFEGVPPTFSPKTGMTGNVWGELAVNLTSQGVEIEGWL